MSIAFRDWMARRAQLGEGRMLDSLVAAFVSVAATFLVAAVVSHGASGDIDDAASDLLANSLPSVSHLMQARTDLRRVEVLVDTLSQARDASTAQVSLLRRARTQLDADILAEASTPWYAGERSAFERRLTPYLKDLDSAADRVTASLTDRTVDEPRLSSAKNDFDRAALGADGALEELAQLNHARAYDAVSSIVHTRARATRLAFALELGSSLIAIIAATLAVRASRRFAALAKRNVEMQTQRANELDVFAQRVAHDLMTPLSAVSFSLLSIERAHPSGETRALTERARRGLERTRQIVDGIYAFARSGAQGDPQSRAPLRHVLAAAIDDLASAEGANAPAVRVEPFTECAVRCNSAALGIVISNLLSNAAKFSRESPQRLVIIRVGVGPERVRVEVEDSGPGFAPGDAEKLFDAYWRAPNARQPGLGLGLATVKRLIVAHGGSVGAARAESGGAVIWFELPRTADDEARENSGDGEAEKSGALLH